MRMFALMWRKTGQVLWLARAIHWRDRYTV
jgi:hypothetical protein